MPDKKVAEMTEDELRKFIQEEVRKALHSGLYEAFRARQPQVRVTSSNGTTELPDWAKRG